MLNNQFNRYVRSKGLDPYSLTNVQRDEEMSKMKHDLYPGRTQRTLSCHDFWVLMTFQDWNRLPISSLIPCCQIWAQMLLQRQEFWLREVMILAIMRWEWSGFLTNQRNWHKLHLLILICRIAVVLEALFLMDGKNELVTLASHTLQTPWLRTPVTPLANLI